MQFIRQSIAGHGVRPCIAFETSLPIVDLYLALLRLEQEFFTNTC